MAARPAADFVAAAPLQADGLAPASPPSEAVGGTARSGPDLARAALAQAKARAREQGLEPRSVLRRRPAVARNADPDGRDPVLFGSAIRRLVAERGWEQPTAAAGVLGRWSELVGAGIAEHCEPASLIDGELVLVAESSAWATQLRLMTRMLVGRLAAQVGPEVVRRIVVRGPAQPDWRKGPRRVQGRGPRDTYG